MKTAAIVTTCKGRLDFLKQTLPVNLKQDYPGFQGVVVVDYGCPDGTSEWCKSLDDSRVRCVAAINNADHWNMSRARNIGFANSDADVILPVDSDVSCPPNYVTRMMDRIQQTGCDLCSVLADCGGQNSHCAVTRDAWEHVRGYDESLEGWGYEDNDFRNRLEASGLKLELLGNCGLSLIQHSDELRTRFLKHPMGIWASAEENLQIIRRGSLRTVNPHGFGNI